MLRKHSSGIEPCTVAHTKTALLVSFLQFFTLRCSCGFGSAVVVLPQNRGCILNKGGCLNYRRTCILYRGYCLLYRGTCLIYKGSCKFTAVVAYLKNMRFRRLNRNRGFGYCLAVWCGCGAILFKCG